MRRRLTVAAFVAGLGVGVLATSHVWIATSRLLREAALAEYQHEQLIYASRARRSGDAFRSVVHWTNVADAQAEIGFRWLHRSRAETYWNWFSLPWISYPLVWDIDPYMASSEAFRNGRRLAEAHYRAQAALALEQFGHPNLAGEQWKQARELMPGWTIEEHREYASHHPWGSFDQSYENAFLDSESSEELSSALERLRAATRATD